MIEPTLQDLNLSFTFINYLTSGYQASIASLSFLHEMGASTYEPKYYQYSAERLSLVFSWIKKFASNELLFRADWKEPETEDSLEALRTVDSLKRELVLWVNEVHRILSSKSHTYALEDVKILISQFGRIVYSQAFFLRGMREYGKIIGSQELQQDVDRLAPTTEQELSIVHSMIDTVAKGQELGSDFFESLTFHSSEIPTRIYVQIHDLNLLLSTYDRAFTFERAGIGEEEAEEWSQAGIEAVEASFWRAHAIGPSETVLWKKSNILDPVYVSSWKRYQFAPEEAMEWIVLNFSAALARKWKDSGYAPEQAAQRIAEQEQNQPKQDTGIQGFLSRQTQNEGQD
jgi:hypothetical protein